MGGGKGGGAKIQVSEYRMSIHFGVCTGPVDHISGIYIGEKEMWSGMLAYPGAVIIDKEDLFGGNKREGGVSGTVTYLPGDEMQVMPEYLAEKYGRTSGTMWAYRGIASVFFHENMNVGGSRLGTAPSAASGFVQFSSNPSNGDQVTIGTRVYQFLDEPSEQGHIPIGSTIAQSMASLATAVNGGLLFGGSDSFFRTEIPHPTCFAELDSANNRVRIIARQAGSTGSSIILAVTGLAMSVSGPTLSGGSGGGFGVWVTQWLSSLISAIGNKGFYLGANNPYLKPIWVKVARSAKGLDKRYEKLWRGTEEFDSNPAHIIFECLYNRVWGMGAPLASIDTKSFERAAKTLYEENFGLSLMWSRSVEIEAFIGEVLDHIEATLFVNPRTGLLTLKLIRDDYDVSKLKVIGPDVSTVENFSRKYWGETVNEIVVTWTNPESEQEETVTAQDLANIAIQGGIVSNGRNYYGVRSADLAMALAERDLRAASYPIATCDLIVDRTAWDLLPGEVCKIVSPDDNITEIIMRVGPVDYGKPGETEIRVSLAEDVFSLATAEYSSPPTSEWVDGSENPIPAAYRYYFTLPFFLTQRQVAPSGSEPPEYPIAFVGSLAGQVGSDTAFYELHTSSTDIAGNTVVEQLTTFGIIAYSELTSEIEAEPSTLIASFSNRTQGPGPIAGSFVVFGGLIGADEEDVELALVQSVSDSGFTLLRGVLDTVPKEWPVGTPIWFFNASHPIADQTPRAAGETAQYWILPKTSRGTLPIGQAPMDEYDVSDRPWLPTRPANVWINGEAFVPVVDCSELEEVSISWSTRNRLLEDAQVLPWWEASIPPESGQTTRIEVYSLSGDLLETHTGLSGESFDFPTLPTARFEGRSHVRLVFKAERDDLISLQGYSQVIKLPSGYGYAYGYNYGGYSE